MSGPPPHPVRATCRRPNGPLCWECPEPWRHVAFTQPPALPEHDHQEDNTP